MYPCVHDTIKTVLTSGQRDSVISLISFLVFASVNLLKAGFSWVETCLASFEVSVANAPHYRSFMLKVYYIIAYNYNFAKQSNLNTFLEFILEFFAEQNLSRLEFCIATQC